MSELNITPTLKRGDEIIQTDICFGDVKEIPQSWDIYQALTFSPTDHAMAPASQGSQFVRFDSSMLELVNQCRRVRPEMLHGP